MFNRKKYDKEYRRNNPIKNREKQKRYYEKNREKIRERKKKWRKNNPEKIKQYQKQYRKNNPEKVKEKEKKYREKRKIYAKKYNKQYRENHPQSEYIKKRREYDKKYYQTHKEIKNRYNKERYKTDPKVRTNDRMSRAIYASLKRNKNCKHWESFVDYNVNDLIKHLKKTMPKGYTWENYMEGKLHIDHIIPIRVFNFTELEHPDFKLCWSLENLRLIPIKENLIKGGKISKPFQPALKIIFPF